MTASVRTTCPYCGVGCGVLVKRGANGVEVRGDPDHPANAGRLCSKGSALAETLSDADRLLHPQIDSQRVSWDTALSHVADRFGAIIREHGPGAVAFYVSGQLLTEDYYVANKLMKGFIGTANIDTNSRLCMASAVTGHKRAFGADVVPGCYEDFDLADLVVLVGSNTAWCHPVLYQRIVRAKERRPQMQIVVIDPRRTPTCDIADLHLPVRAGSDVWLFAGLLAFLDENGSSNARFVSEHTSGLEAALDEARASAGDLHAVAKACGIEPPRLRRFYELFACTERVVTAFSQGVNQSSSGTDKVNSIINCHLLTGRIGRPGMGPFSITGQPNAMGGREAGGMASTLAAHMDIERAEHRQALQAFWQSPTMVTRGGLKAVDMFDAIHRGEIKAVWIMATNPVVSLPDANRAREALQRCELVVVSDCVALTDTLDLAHVRLPAAAWGEKDGTVTNSERCISRQRAFRAPSGEAQPDWWIVAQVARRMGFAEAFAYESSRDIFVEHARLSALNNASAERAFDIGVLATVSPEEYEALAPVQWPVRSGPRFHGTARLGGEGHFFHPDGKARFIPTPPRAPAHTTDEDFPYVLNTGRVRDQWHTMTRTGQSARLADHLPEPFIDLHAQDALVAGVREGELARVITRWGSIAGRVRTSGEIARGAVFVPIHWNGANATDARIGAAVNPVVDPLSGEPEFKHTPARVEPMPVDWFGVLFTRERAALDTTWWTEVRGETGFRYELAGRQLSRGARPSHAEWARTLLGAAASTCDYFDYEDASSGVYRAAFAVNNRLEGYIALAARTELPSRTWLASLFAQPRLQDADRRALLAGRSLIATADTGPLVCSCFRVGRNTIAESITQHGLTTCAQIGTRLKAGTNCGSCLPEIRRLLATNAAPKPAMTKIASPRGEAITNS